jgi:hypothetical protein
MFEENDEVYWDRRRMDQFDEIDELDRAKEDDE